MGNASTAYVKGTETDDGYVINTKNMKPGDITCYNGYG